MESVKGVKRDARGEYSVEIVKRARGDSIEAVIYDRGDYVEIMPKGVLINENGITMTQGGNELRPSGAKQSLSLPPLVLIFPKKLPEDETECTKVLDEAGKRAREKFMSSFREAREKFLASNQTADGVTHQVEAHNIDQEPRTNILAMKELKSAPDNCAEPEGTVSFNELAAGNMGK